MTMVADQEAEQIPLLDLSGKEFNAMWVDENAPLFVANNPLHWKAHKLQVAIARLDKIAEKNPAQFNSTAYFAALDKLADLMQQINERRDEKILDERRMAEIGDGSSEAEDSEIEPISMDP